MKYIILLFLLFILNCTNTNLQAPPKAINGVIDLRQWNFQEDETVELSGDWELYWNQIVEPNNVLEDFKGAKTGYIQPGRRWQGSSINGIELNGIGVATYRLKLLFSEDSIGKMFGVKFKTTGGLAYKIYVNKELLAELGKVGSSKETMVPTRKTKEIHFMVKNKEIILTIPISNFYHANGTFWYAPRIGLSSQINFQSKRKLIINTILFGSIIIMALYHLSLYIYLKKDRTSLAFGLFCLTISIYIMSTDEVFIYYLFPNLPYWVAHRLLSIYCITIPSYLTFLYYLFRLEFSLKIVKIISLFYSLAYLFVLLAPAEISSFIEAPLRLIVVASFIYAFFGVTIAFIRKRESSKLLFIPNTILVISIISDILVLYGYIHIPLLITYSIFIFIISQSILLSQRFSRTFLEVENLSEKLQKINENLERKVEERTYQYKKEKERAENENLWKDRFIALVSHDLRSPISSVLNIHELLLKQESGISQESRYFLERTKDILFNSLSMVKHLLNLNRFQSGTNNRLEYKDIDLKEICDAIAEHFSMELNRKQILISMPIKENTILTVDETIFTEVFRNLIMNAIKYTGENGQIKIEYQENNHFQKVIIKDTGIGIAEQNKSFLFTKDVVITEGTRGERGFGIGLKLCQELISLHNGKIEVESIDGVGSSFIVSFPTNRYTILAVTSTTNLEDLKMTLHKKSFLLIHTDSFSVGANLLEEIEIKALLIYLDFTQEVLLSFLQSLFSNLIYLEKPVLFIGSISKIQKVKELFLQYFSDRKNVYYIEKENKLIELLESICEG